MAETTVFEAHPLSLLKVSGSLQRFPVHRIYCVARNYAAHAEEMGQSEREAPFFFSKPADAVTQADTIQYPSATAELHHEVELVLALGPVQAPITTATALDSVFGYAVGVDLTRRDLQAQAKAKARPWDIAKGFDDSAPLSLIVPATECGHPGSGRIELKVNDELRQQGLLEQMIWNPAEILVALAELYELRAGDLIFTGTPAGVAALKPGDGVEISVAGVTSHRFAISP